jgi:hypothetical protein
MAIAPPPDELICFTRMMVIASRASGRLEVVFLN